MLNHTREQLLIRAINLLDNASPGEHKENVLNLLHCARRASRERDDFRGRAFSIEALARLDKARLSLRARGAPEQEIAPLEAAITLLLPLKEDAGGDTGASGVGYLPDWRCLLLLFLLFAGIALVVML